MPKIVKLYCILLLFLINCLSTQLIKCGRLSSAFSEEQDDLIDIGVVVEEDDDIPPPPEESPRVISTIKTDISEVPSRSPTNKLSHHQTRKTTKAKNHLGANKKTKLLLDEEIIESNLGEIVLSNNEDDNENNENDNDKSITTESVLQGIRFTPSILVYKNSPLAIPTVADFRIDNIFHSDIFLFSVESDDDQFHPVMFQPQGLACNNTVTIPLLFLPNSQETVFTTITVSTSEGVYLYDVEAYPAPNRYRLVPFRGYKLTAGSPSLSLPITIHNPHNEALHIREVLTTEEFLTLQGDELKRGFNDNNNENVTQHVNSNLLRSKVDIDLYLPNSINSNNINNLDVSAISTSDSKSNSNMMWTIPAHSEQQLFFLSISTDLDPGEYKGFLHVKTDHDNIVLSVQFEIITGEVFAVNNNIIDFGVLPSVSERNEIDLWLVNTCAEDLVVTEIVPMDPDPQLEIILFAQPIILFGGGQKQTSVAHLIYTAGKPGKFDKTLLVFTNNTNPALAVIEITYTVTVFHGAISLDDDSSVFVSPIQNISYYSWSTRKDGSISYKKAIKTKKGKEEDDNIMTNKIVLKNYFDIPVSIESIVVMSSCADFLTIDSDLITNGNIDNSVNELESWEPILAIFNYSHFNHLVSNKSVLLPKSCILDIETNISNHRYPVHIMDGALAVSFVDAHMIEDYKEINAIEKLYGLSNRPPLNTRNTKNSIDASLSINSDTYHIDLGNISVFEPRLVRFALSNSNPSRIPFNLTFASEKTCLCYESSFPIGSKDEDAAAKAIKGAKSINYQDSLTDTSRCACLANNSNTNGNFSSRFSNDVGLVKPLYHSLYSLSFFDLLNNSKVNITHGQSSMIRIELTSPYQKIILFLHFKVIKSKLRSKFLLGNKINPKQFIFGRNNTFRMYTKSRFRRPLDDLLISMKHFMYELSDLRMSNEGGESKFLYTVDPIVFMPSSSIYFENDPPWKFNLWSCIHNTLNNFIEVENINNINIADELEQVQELADYLRSLYETTYQSHSNLTTKIQAFNMKNKFNQIWKLMYPTGVKLLPTYAVIQSSVTYHNYKVENFTVQSPTVFMPDEYRILLPTATVGQVVWFYIEVYNPFNFPVEFKLFQHSYEKLNSRHEITKDLDNFNLKSSQITSAPALSLYDCEYSDSSNNEDNFQSLDDDYIAPTICRDEPRDSSHITFEIIRGVSFYRKAKKATLKKFKFNESDKLNNSPFMMMSSEDHETIIPSNSVGKLGPIFFFPNQDSSDINTEHFFIHNSFSGYDKVKVIGVSGVSKFIVDGVYSKNTSRLAKQNAVNKNWEVQDIIVNNLGEVYTVSIKNIGDVASIVESFYINNNNCDTLKKSSVFSFFNYHTTTHPSQCEKLPVEVSRGQTYNISIVSPLTCSYSYSQYKININFENDDIDRTVEKSFKVLINFKFNPQLVSKCLETDKYGIKYYLKFLLLIIIGLLVLQVITSIRKLFSLQNIPKETSDANIIDNNFENHIASILKEKKKILKKHIPIKLPDIFRNLSSSGIDLNDVTINDSVVVSKNDTSKLKYVTAVLHRRTLNESTVNNNNNIETTDEHLAALTNEESNQYELLDPNINGEESSFTEIKSKSKQANKSTNKTTNSNAKKNILAVNVSSKSDNSDTSVDENFTSARSTPVNNITNISIVPVTPSPPSVKITKEDSVVVKEGDAAAEVDVVVVKEEVKDKTIPAETIIKEEDTPKVASDYKSVVVVRKGSFDNTVKQKSPVVVVKPITTKVSPPTSVKLVKSSLLSSATVNKLMQENIVVVDKQPLLSSAPISSSSSTSTSINSKEIRSTVTSVNTTIAKKAIFNAVNQSTKEKQSVITTTTTTTTESQIPTQEVTDANNNISNNNKAGFISTTSSSATLDNFLEQFTDKNNNNNNNQSNEQERLSIAFPTTTIIPDPFDSMDSNDSPLFYYQNDLMNNDDNNNIISSPIKNNNNNNNSFFSWAQSQNNNNNDAYLLQPSADPIFIAPSTSHDDLLFFDPINNNNNNNINNDDNKIKNNFSGFDNLLKGLDLHSLGDFGGLGFGSSINNNNNNNNNNSNNSAEESVLTSLFSDFDNSNNNNNISSNTNTNISPSVGFSNNNNKPVSSFVPEFPPGFSPTKLQSISYDNNNNNNNNLQSNSYDDNNNIINLQSNSYDNPTNLGTNPRAPSFHPISQQQQLQQQSLIPTTTTTTTDTVASFYSTKDKQFVKVSTENIYHEDFLEAQAWINELGDEDDENNYYNNNNNNNNINNNNGIEEVEEVIMPPFVRTSYYNNNTRKFDTIQSYQIEHRQIPQQQQQQQQREVMMTGPPRRPMRGRGGYANNNNNNNSWSKNNNNNNININRPSK